MALVTSSLTTSVAVPTVELHPQSRQVRATRSRAARADRATGGSGACTTAGPRAPGQPGQHPAAAVGDHEVLAVGLPGQGLAQVGCRAHDPQWGALPVPHLGPDGPEQTHGFEVRGSGDAGQVAQDRGRVIGQGLQQGQVSGLGDVLQGTVDRDDLGVADAMTVDGRRGVVRGVPVGEGEMSASIRQQPRPFQLLSVNRAQPGSGAAS